jgi:hypothetical protein
MLRADPGVDRADQHTLERLGQLFSARHEMTQVRRGFLMVIQVGIRLKENWSRLEGGVFSTPAGQGRKDAPF